MVNMRWKMGLDTCPVCRSAVEDWFYVLVTQSPDMLRVREGISSLTVYMIKYIDNLYQKRQPDKPNEVNEKYNSKFQQAYTNQCAIGWDNFLRGVISKSWRFLQHTYFLEQKNRDMYAVCKFRNKHLAFSTQVSILGMYWL